MKSKGLLLVVLAFTFLSLLAGCSDFDEMKSQRMLMDAEKLIDKGEEEQGAQLLSELITRYPATQSVGEANQKLYRLLKKREMRDRAKFGKILGSVQQVLDGYHSMYSLYPVLITELDQSNYFFDSSYLAEIPPEGFRVYLKLEEDGSGFTAWCIENENERGYRIEEQRRMIRPFQSLDLLARLKKTYKAADWSSSLVVLQPL